MRTVLLLLLTIGFVPAAFGQKKKKSESPPLKEKTTPVEEIGKEMKTPSGLIYKFLKRGEGAPVEEGDRVTIHYVEKLENDSVIDDSRKTGNPFSFKVVSGEAIPGIVELVKLMRVGDIAECVLSPKLGYGSQQAGSIPPNSTLKFKVEVIETKGGVKPFKAIGDTVKLLSGLKYLVAKKGTGDKPASGDIVTIHYTGYLPDGKVFDSSVERNEPVKFNLGGSLPGLDEGIGQMNKGAKFRLVLPYALAFGEAGRGPIPPRTNIIYDVELIEFRKKINPVPFAVKGKDTTTTASGLKYIVVASGKGEQGGMGKKVKVHYTGFLSDGSIFDSSVERDTHFEFTLGLNSVIPGWMEALQIMKEGDKWRLIIPPGLAYGPNGMPPKIPANATLIFDVELVDVE